MRKRTLFALGMCAAVLRGEVSLTFARQAQSPSVQTSGPQSAPPQSQATGEQAPGQKAQSSGAQAPTSAMYAPGKQGIQASGQQTAVTQSQRAGQQDAPRQSQQTGQKSATQQVQPTAKQSSGQKTQAQTLGQRHETRQGQPTQSQPAGKQASAQNPQATQPSQQMAKTAPSPKGQPARPPAIPAGYRLLSLNEGRAIAQGMAWADDEEGLSPDCSHLVHTLYQQAGYPYPYASSLDLYRGTGPFLRVRYAHPGDLVVWRGHVGIIVNPREHSFFSTTSSGARIQSYRSAYWRGRGYPHFFRYLTKSPLKSGATSEASNRTPAVQHPALKPAASQPPTSQPKDPPQD